MRHLRICNFGPLLEAELDIDRLNVIVGPQSSGKSSVLKVSAYCAWLESVLNLRKVFPKQHGIILRNILSVSLVFRGISAHQPS